MGAIFQEEPLKTLRLDDFDYFRSVIRDLCGISLSSNKKELVQARLRARVRELGFFDFTAYRSLLESLSPQDKEWQVLINCLTTNKTEWFREPDHFDYLTNEFIPKWKRSGKEKLSVWCAACSSGEEVYTVAMVLQAALGDGYSFEVLGTDIDTEVLYLARNGVYPVANLDQIPERYRSASLARGTGEIANWMKIKRSLKSKVSFDQLNLIHGPYPWKERFDLILCRNVFIYFSREMIQEIVGHFYPAAASGASLLIGHSESLQNIRSSWSYIGPSIFSKGSNP
jgi:chemotaxis protein methyltransferase CheR